MMRILLLICLVHTQAFYAEEWYSQSDYDNDARKDTKFFQFFTENGQENLKTLDEGSKFDFIIVGGGSSGSVLANRLSEVKEWNILLLEAGHEAPSITDIPMLAPAFQFTDLNWGYLMERQEGVGLGLTDKRMTAPRGKALGGSSIINYMLAVRGNKGDYDNWAKMGNTGWGYKDVLKYFKKLEDTTVPIQDAEYRGREGPMSIQEPPYRTALGDVLLRVCEEAGHKYVDYNGKEQVGISKSQGTIKKGKRYSAEKAYLRPIKGRTNLKILTGARVTEILINATTKEAYGVKYLKNGKYYTVTARKEIICTAGAFNSPQLLMLSGIGPKSHLDEFNITLIKDLPVGQKMYDHLAFLGLTFTVNQSITFSTTDFLSPVTLFEITQGKGPLTSIIATDDLLYLKVLEGDPTFPDVEVIFLSAGFQLDFGLIFRKVFRISDEVYNAVWKPLIGKHVFQAFPLFLHPNSFGYLKLKSKNPLDLPKLYGNYLTDPENIDMKVYLLSIREIQRIISMPAMQKYDASIWSAPIPGCEQHKFDSDEYWICGVRSISASIYHQSSTCKMGPKTDPEAVVDPRLKVYGVKRLRVADASTFPTPVAAHLNLPTLMVAEKAADIIKEDYNVII